MELQKNHLIEILLCGACLLSCLSQLPNFVVNGMTRTVSFPLWIISFFILIMNSQLKIDRNILKLAIPSGLFVLLVLMASFCKTDVSYLSSSLFYSFLISMFIFWIGNMGGKYISDKVIEKICLCYVIGTLVVSLFVFKQYFGFGYDLSSRIYGYASKNSFAQIVFTSIIILMVKFNTERKILFFIKWAIVAFEFILMAYLRSRATLVSFLISMVVLVFSKNTRKNLKVLVILGCIVLIFFILTDKLVKEMIVNNILFAGRESTNLDQLSSGRISIIQKFPELIKDNVLWGIGSEYFECFYLSAILQFGILAGAVLIIISMIPAYYSVHYACNSENWYILMLISVGYLVDGLFEGITPFGAGIKCFFMWFLFGILISNRHFY